MAVCKAESCEREAVAKGFCKPCYCADYHRRVSAGEHKPNPQGSRKCKVFSCNEPYYAKDLCQSHYNASRREHNAELNRVRYAKKREAIREHLRKRYATDESYRERKRKNQRHYHHRRRMKRERALQTLLAERGLNNASEA